MSYFFANALTSRGDVYRGGSSRISSIGISSRPHGHQDIVSTVSFSQTIGTTFVIKLCVLDFPPETTGQTTQASPSLTRRTFLLGKVFGNTVSLSKSVLQITA